MRALSPTDRHRPDRGAFDDRAAQLIAQGVDWRAAVDAATEAEATGWPRPPVAPGRVTRTAALPRVWRDAAEPPSDLARGLAGARDLRGGEPLPSTLRRRLETALGGADLGAVRLHTGPDADLAAQALGARAFAVGQDIAFRAGAYDPDSAAGVALIAHEVAHTRQAPVAADGAPVSEPGDAAEREADAFAASFVQTRPHDDPFGLHLVDERPAAVAPAPAPAPTPAGATVRRDADASPRFRIPEQLELTVADLDLFDYNGFSKAWPLHDGELELLKLTVPIFDIPVTFRANLRTQGSASVGGGYGPGRVTGVKVTLPTSLLSTAELADIGLAAERDGRKGAERAARRALPGKLVSARGLVEVPAHLQALLRGTAAIDVTGGDPDGIVTVGGEGKLSALARHQADARGALAATFLYRVHQPLALAANLSLGASFALTFDVAGLLRLFARIDAEGERRRKAKRAPARPRLPSLSLVHTRPPWWPTELPWILPPLDGPARGAQRWAKEWTKHYPLLEIADRETWEYGLPLLVADRTATPMPTTPAVPIRGIFEQYQQAVASNRTDLPTPIEGDLPAEHGPDPGTVAAAERASAAAIDHAAAAIHDEHAWTERALTTGGGSARAELEARRGKLEAWAASVPHLRADHAAAHAAAQRGDAADRADALAQFRAIERNATELSTQARQLHDTRPATEDDRAALGDLAREAADAAWAHLLGTMRAEVRDEAGVRALLTTAPATRRSSADVRMQLHHTDADAWAVRATASRDGQSASADAGAGWITHVDSSEPRGGDPFYATDNHEAEHVALIDDVIARLLRRAEDDRARGDGGVPGAYQRMVAVMRDEETRAQARLALAGVRFFIRPEPLAGVERDRDILTELLVTPNESKRFTHIPIGQATHLGAKKGPPGIFHGSFDERVVVDGTSWNWDRYPRYAITAHPANAHLRYRTATKLDELKPGAIPYAFVGGDSPGGPHVKEWRDHLSDEIGRETRAILVASPGLDRASAEGQAKRRVLSRYQATYPGLQDMSDLELRGARQWQAHHVHEHSWGGGGERINFQYLVRGGEHQELTNWWNTRRDEMKHALSL